MALIFMDFNWFMWLCHFSAIYFDTLQFREFFVSSNPETILSFDTLHFREFFDLASKTQPFFDKLWFFDVNWLRFTFISRFSFPFHPQCQLSELRFLVCFHFNFSFPAKFWFDQSPLMLLFTFSFSCCCCSALNLQKTKNGGIRICSS